MIHAWQPTLAAGDNWVGLIFFVIIVLGPLVLQALKKFRGETDEDEMPSSPRRATPPPRPPSTPRPTPSGGSTAQSEEIRKFLEALGKPKSAPPPPPILRPVQQAPRRPPPPPRPRVPVPPPVQRRPVMVESEGVSEEQEDEAPRNIITGESTRHAFKPMERIDLSQAMAAVELEVAQAAKTTAAIPTVATSNRAAHFAQLLANRSNVRQAVVLAEIIGPPKAFS